MQYRDFWIYFIAICIGLFGAMIYMTGYHIWLDHKLVDDIRIQIQQQHQPEKK